MTDKLEDSEALGMAQLVLFNCFYRDYSALVAKYLLENRELLKHATFEHGQVARDFLERIASIHVYSSNYEKYLDWDKVPVLLSRREAKGLAEALDSASLCDHDLIRPALALINKLIEGDSNA